jgi:hypothetical protein
MLYNLRVIVITSQHIERDVFNIIMMVQDLPIPLEMNLVAGSHQNKAQKKVKE